MDLSDTGAGDTAPVFYSSRENRSTEDPATPDEHSAEDRAIQMEDSEPVTETQDNAETPPEGIAKRLDALTTRLLTLESKETDLAARVGRLEAAAESPAVDAVDDTAVEPAAPETEAEAEFVAEPEPEPEAFSEPEPEPEGFAEPEPESAPDTGAEVPASAEGASYDPNALAEALRAVLDERPDATGEIKEALDALATEAATRGQRVEDALTALEASVASLLSRPAPAPDLTLQRQGFSRIATALSTALGRLDTIGENTGAAVARIEERLEAAPAAGGAATGASHDRLDATLSSFIDKLDALVQSMGAGGAASGVDLADLPDRLEDICTRLTAMLESKSHEGEASLAEDLRDLRTLVAELIADNRRLQVA